MITNIYFIRHAESPFIFGKEKERPLSEKGFKDAKTIADKLSHIHFDQFISSSYNRAIQTVEPLANGAPIKLYKELREKTLKGAYKSSEEEIENAIEMSLEDHEFKLEGGETTKEVLERSIPVIESILQDETLKTVAIGTHGNIMTIIMNYYRPEIGYEFWKSTTKPDVYQCTFEGSKLKEITRI
ncbi:histidine phosphatase family protein [Macrococcus sp. DPC7161]|uniref:histidine phosphatase family protein n=1 Tax=Macrococcus sp. DPC7161 TaxID=2507060 RepID=UPI00100B3668|nr:histidine phosphatase family protein [Macrococcus sp. DPC7161]RXK17474.1 histidine phosphatase family protein [Macrococcus sp. DPC7161]